MITSEHCLEGETYKTLQITVGSNDLRRGTEYYAEFWTTYSDWYYDTYNKEPKGENDVAIIKVMHILGSTVKRTQSRAQSTYSVRKCSFR